MRSMTGFGSGSGNDGKLAVTLEMRAVNQRFLELNIRMPHAYLALEDRLRNGIKPSSSGAKSTSSLPSRIWTRRHRMSASTTLP